MDQRSVTAEIPARLPTLIDIERATKTSLTSDEITSHLKSIVADVRVDDHVTWLSELMHLIDGIVLISSVMAVMATLTLAIHRQPVLPCGNDRRNRHYYIAAHDGCG